MVGKGRVKALLHEAKTDQFAIIQGSANLDKELETLNGPIW